MRNPHDSLLSTVGADDLRAAADLLPQVYEELRRLARSRMANLPPGNTIQPTALVHEAYLRLVGQADPGWHGRGHFFAAAAQAMREILVDAARRRAARKRGGDRKRLSLVEDEIGPLSAIALEMPCDDLIALDAALDKLRDEHPRASDVMLLRQFGGLANTMIADVLGVTTRTVERDWQFGRAWLSKEMATASSGGQD